MAKLGVCSWSLRPSDPIALVERMRALEIPRIQLALVPCIADAKWHGAVDRLRGDGIEILSGMLAMAGEDYSTLESIAQTGGVRSDTHWGTNLDQSFAVAEFAERSDISLITFHAGFLPHSASDPLRAKMLDRLRTIADIFAARGVGLAFETGQEDARSLAVALKELDRPSVGVNFDPANMILYGMGDPIDAVEILAPWIRQVHIKDAIATTARGTWGREVPVGEGDVDWPRFLAALPSGDDSRTVDLVIERESGACRDEDITRARDLVRGLAPTIQ